LQCNQHLNEWAVHTGKREITFSPTFCPLCLGAIDSANMAV
jgi:hypothetical protein